MYSRKSLHFSIRNENQLLTLQAIFSIHIDCVWVCVSLHWILPVNSACWCLSYTHNSSLFLSALHYIHRSKFVFTWSRVFQYIKSLFSTIVTLIYPVIVKCICSTPLYIYITNRQIEYSGKRNEKTIGKLGVGNIEVQIKWKMMPMNDQQ